MSRFLDQPSSVWLTGASSGIGEALAMELIRLGHRLVVTGRRAAPLDALATKAPAQVFTATADTTDRDQLAAIAPGLEHFGALDLAILNAGTCEYLEVSQFDSEIIGRNINVNVMGTVRCIETALPALRRNRDRGRRTAIVIVSSSACWFPFARAEGYGASKAALDYLAQALRADLAREGIEVFLVSPGFVETPLTDQNDFPMPFRIPASDAASRIVRGLQKGKHSIEFPRRFTWPLRLLGNLPQRIVDRMAASMARKNNQESDPE